MMNRRNWSCFAIALVLSVVVSMPGAMAAENGVDEIPDPYDGSTVTWQTLAGTGTTALMAGGGLALLYASLAMHHDMSSDSNTGEMYMLGGAGLVLAVPFVTPIPVNAVGNARGYNDQYLGAHLGSIAGATIGVAVPMALGTLDSRRGRRLQDLGIPGYFLGTIAGSVIGYHVQASMRQSDDADSDEAQPMGGPALTPTVEPDGDWGVAAGWQGRF